MSRVARTVRPSFGREHRHMARITLKKQPSDSEPCEPDKRRFGEMTPLERRHCAHKLTPQKVCAEYRTGKERSGLRMTCRLIRTDIDFVDRLSTSSPLRLLYCFYSSGSAMTTKYERHAVVVVAFASPQTASHNCGVAVPSISQVFSKVPSSLGQFIGKACRASKDRPGPSGARLASLPCAWERWKSPEWKRPSRPADFQASKGKRGGGSPATPTPSASTILSWQVSTAMQALPPTTTNHGQ